MAWHGPNIGEYRVDDGAGHVYEPDTEEAVWKLFLTLAFQGGSPTAYQWDETTQCYEESERLMEICREAVSNRLHNRRPGRPKRLQGDYERITLEIRKELLAKVDAERGNKSRREFIETLLEK